jgi:hypothetical protein
MNRGGIVNKLRKPKHISITSTKDFTGVARVYPQIYVVTNNERTITQEEAYIPRLKKIDDLVFFDIV